MLNTSGFRFGNNFSIKFSSAIKHHTWIRPANSVIVAAWLEKVMGEKTQPLITMGFPNWNARNSYKLEFPQPGIINNVLYKPRAPECIVDKLYF